MRAIKVWAWNLPLWWPRVLLRASSTRSIYHLWCTLVFCSVLTSRGWLYGSFRAGKDSVFQRGCSVLGAKAEAGLHRRRRKSCNKVLLRLVTEQRRVAPKATSTSDSSAPSNSQQSSNSSSFLYTTSQVVCISLPLINFKLLR